MREAYKTIGQVTENGGLTLQDKLPFPSGTRVEVIVLAEPDGTARGHSFWGIPNHYVDPTEPVAADDWEAAG